jgi:CMP-N-acetylneuraminic acid synthetase
MTRIAAFVPMRHESERVKGKNYRSLGGRPLYHHIVLSLLACGEIDEVVIDTDSPLIAAETESAFPDVRVLARPAHLLWGEIPMNDVLLNDVEQVEADLYVQTHSTNPLLRAGTIQRALETFLSARDSHDSLFTVTPLHTRLWTPDGDAINHDPNVLLRTQDLPPIMEENSCLYVFDGATLRERGNRIGNRPLLYPLDAHEAWDIDDELDWMIVEALYAQRRSIDER